jgi:hypothetical protein
MKSGDMQHNNGFGLYAAFSFLYVVFNAAEEFFNAMHSIEVEDIEERVVDNTIMNSGHTEIIYTDGRNEAYGTAVNQDELPIIRLFNQYGSSESDDDGSDTSSITGEVNDPIE